jgi:hypothetical protein
MIELGTRRTRRSTLRRIAEALVQATPGGSCAATIADALMQAAGTALAPESGFRDRVDRRRKRRASRGRYGPRVKQPFPGEEYHAYLRRVRVQGMVPISTAPTASTASDR